MQKEARAPCSASSRHHSVVYWSLLSPMICSCHQLTGCKVCKGLQGSHRTLRTSGTSGTLFPSCTPFHHLNIHTQNIRNIRNIRYIRYIVDIIHIRYIVDIIHISSHTEHQVHQVHRSHHCVKTYCGAPLKEPI